MSEGECIGAFGGQRPDAPARSRRPSGPTTSLSPGGIRHGQHAPLHHRDLRHHHHPTRPIGQGRRIVHTTTDWGAASCSSLVAASVQQSPAHGRRLCLRWCSRLPKLTTGSGREPPGRRSSCGTPFVVPPGGRCRDLRRGREPPSCRPLTFAPAKQRTESSAHVVCGDGSFRSERAPNGRYGSVALHSRALCAWAESRTCDPQHQALRLRYQAGGTSKTNSAVSPEAVEPTSVAR